MARRRTGFGRWTRFWPTSNPGGDLLGRLAIVSVKQLPEILMPTDPRQGHHIHTASEQRQCLGPTVMEMKMAQQAGIARLAEQGIEARGFHNPEGAPLGRQHSEKT